MKTAHINIVFDGLLVFFRLRLYAGLLLAVVVAPLVLANEGSVEYCDWESFNAACASDSVILIRSARYGRMKIGRCLTSFYPGEICSRDVTSEFDQRCSGRNSCSVRVIAMNDWHCGSRNFKNFLEASYECHKVANTEMQTCANESSIVLPVAESGILANTFSSSVPANCPFVIRVHPHQRINLTLTDFSVARADQNPSGVQSVQSEPCKQVAIAREFHDNGSSTVTVLCGGRERETIVHMSTANTITILFNQNYTQPVIVKYQAVGCATLVAPPNAWVSRSTEQTTSIQCNWTDEAWHLTCLGIHWVGEIGNCSSMIAHQPGSNDDWSLDDVFTNSSHYPLGVLVVVCMGVAIGVAVGVLMLVIVIAYMRRRRRLTIRQQSTSTLCKKTKMQTASFSSFSRQQITPLSVSTATNDKGSWTRNRPLPDPHMETLYIRRTAPSTACSTATPLNPFEFTLLSSSSGVDCGTSSSTVFSNCTMERSVAGRVGCYRTVSRQPPSLNVRLEAEEACALMSWQSESCLPGNSAAQEETRMDSASPYYFKLDPAAITRRNEEQRTQDGPAQAPHSAPILDTGGCALCHASATLNRRPHIYHCPSPPPAWTGR